MRAEVRKELSIEDRVVIGHIGRFVSQKNHNRLIEIFQEILKKNERAILVLIGDGPLKQDIEEKIRHNKLENNIILLGIRHDVSRVLQSFDLFLFPSLYEGLPFTLVEAQAAGLPCVISDSITNEIIITKNIVKLPLSFNNKEWADEILKMLDNFEELIPTMIFLSVV